MKVFKKVLSVLSAFTMVFVLASCGGQTAQNPAPENGNSTDTKKSDSAAYHIGIVTGTVAQSEDEFRAGQKAIEMYGDAKSGGMIVHDTYPDNFMAEQDTTLFLIQSYPVQP